MTEPEGDRLEEEAPVPESTERVLTEEEIAMIQEECTTLLEFLEREPGAIQDIERIISEQLSGGVKMETWAAIFDSLSVYAGEDNTRFLLMLVLSRDAREYLDQVEANVGSEVWRSLRTLLALYSSAVIEAYFISMAEPNDWRFVNRKLYYVPDIQGWYMAFEIIKNNAERMTIEGPAISWLTLANLILDWLNGIPPDEAPGSIERTVVEEFANIGWSFLQLFAPDLAEGGADEEVDEIST